MKRVGRFWQDGHSNIDAATDIRAVRHRLVDTGLLFLSIFGPLALAGTVARTQSVGWQPVFTLQVVCIVLIVSAAVFRRKLPHGVKAALLVGSLAAAGIGGVYTFGLLASGIGILYAAPTIVAVLFGTRTGLAACAVIAALIAGLGVLIRLGIHEIDAQAAAYGATPAAWIMTAAVYIFLAPLCVVAVGAVYSHMLGSLEKVRRSEAQYRTLFDNSRDAFMTLAPPDWRFRSANPAMIDMFRAKDARELTACGPAELSPETQPGGVPSAEKAKAHIAEAMTTGSAYFEWRHRRFDGTEFPATVLLTRLDLEGERLLQATVRDITEQKRREESLERSEERLRDIFESANDIIVSIDPDGRIDYANPRFYETLGYAPDETAYRSIFALLHPESRADGQDMLQHVLSGEALIDAELTFMTKSGAKLLTEGSVRCHFENGEPQAIRGIFRDITRSRGLEEQLRQAQKMEAVGQLAGGVAHDFNNLLQAITGYGQIAIEELEGHAVRPELEEMMKAAGRATVLVRQLLAFSRRQVLELQELDLSEIVGDLSKMMRRVIGEHIAYRFHAEPGLSRIVADKGQIEQILMNLCVNARDAMPQGGSLTVELSNTELSAAFCAVNDWAKPGKYVVLAVTDTGCGMDAETQERIFEPFYTTKETGHGTGLGLSTVFGIVKQHNGRIHVYSELGVGSTFRIYLPMAESGAQAVPSRDASAAPQGGAETILLAEDDAAVRELAVRFLTKAGYTVHAAANGVEAIQRFDALGGAVDLAILDVIMPQLNGTAVFEHVGKSEQNIPVLFASGYSTEAVHTNFVLKPGVHLIQKPYHFDELLAKVRELLDQRVGAVEGGVEKT